MRALRLLAIASLVVPLSACSAFYPNWGAEAPQDAFSNEMQDGDVNEIDPQPQPDSVSEPETEPDSEVAEPEEPAEEVATERTKVKVEIYSAMVYQDEGILEVIAQGIGFVEDGGSCTLRFISGSTEESMTVKAASSSDYTQCSPIDLPLAGLPSGTGVVTVGYESETHTGVSSAYSVVIP